MEEFLHSLVQSLSSWLLLLLVGICLIILFKGADWLVSGAVQLAYRTGLPKIMIGATIVSLGTTAPEVFVSVLAAWTGNPGLALGNGVGSIIADTGLVLGLACILAPVPLNRFLLQRTGLFQVGSACLLVLLASLQLFLSPQEPYLHRWTGFLFLGLLVLYIRFSYTWAQQDKSQLPQELQEQEQAQQLSIPSCLVLLLAGLFLVLFAARLLVPSATELAVRLGVSQDVIAASVVALGTSLPELVTAVSSVRKGHPELLVGNIVGADVLNCLFVIGASAAASPLLISKTFYQFHFPALLIILFSFRIFIATNKSGYFSKAQGAWLLGIYLLYIFLQYSLNLNLEGALGHV
ncbi:MAG: calcium/sodium antiporter [Desulfohalobiaceae bacterium]